MAQHTEQSLADRLEALDRESRPRPLRLVRSLTCGHLRRVDDGQDEAKWSGEEVALLETLYNHLPEIIAALRSRHELEAEVARLRETIAALQGGQWKTRDGVTIHRDMPVYVVTDSDGIQVDGLVCRPASYDAYDVSDVFASKKAAAAARAEQPQPEGGA